MPGVVDTELAGRTALVTGAGSGVGRQVAVELAAAGARVVLVGRRPEPLEETAAAIESSHRRESDGSQEPRALPLAADVRRRDWYGQLDALAPEIDVLVHSAAAWAPREALEDVDGEESERVLETSLGAALALASHVVGGMKRRGFGRIVSIGSVAAEQGAVGLTCYAAAKAGLVGLTRSLAAETARAGVTVNLVQLGWIDTPRIAELTDDDTRGWFEERTAAGRPGTVDEVAHAVRFLCSPRASYVTGACLEVSGGLGLGIYPFPGS